VFGPSEQDPSFDELFQPQVGIEQIRTWPDYTITVTAAEEQAEGES
jgi:hypothetical protein